MAYSQSELGKRFFDGATSGSASNVKIVETDDETLLVGYGHAVYAERDKQTGRVTYYKGWYGRSQSTSSQISKMRLSSKADKVRDERMEL